MTKETWSDMPLKSLGEFRNGVNFDKSKKRKGEIGLINVKDIFTDIPSIDFENLDNVDLADESGIEKYYVKAGDLFFVRSSVKRDGVGLVSISSRDNSKAIHCGFVIRFRPDLEKINSRFLAYQLRSPLYRQKIIGMSGGSAIINISQETLGNLAVGIPSIPTQHRIADILSAYDNLIENNTRRIRILEKMAQSIYQEWFGKVDKDSLPEGWIINTLEQVSKNFDSKRIPLSSMKRAEMQGIYPYYGAAKVLDHINDFIFDGKYLLIAEDGSVITTDGKPVLQMAYSKFWVNNHTHILQGIDPISTEYLYLRLSELDINGYITGAAQPKITQANLNRITFLIPPKDILLEFNEIVLNLFDEMEILQRKNTNLRRTRDLLLPRLVSGEIEVSSLSEPVA